jgi:hypothetical protein
MKQKQNIFDTDLFSEMAAFGASGFLVSGSFIWLRKSDVSPSRQIWVATIRIL